MTFEDEWKGRHQRLRAFIAKQPADVRYDFRLLPTDLIKNILCIRIRLSMLILVVRFDQAQGVVKGEIGING